MLERLKKNIDKGIVSVSVKSSTYLEGEKLKAKISNSREEIEGDLKRMGKQVYQTWKEKGIVDEAYVAEVCRCMLEKENEAESYEDQRQQLEAEKEKILKKAGKPEEIHSEEGILCTCGSSNEVGAKFCRTCGRKLEQGKEIRVCKNCQAPLEEGAKFCMQCGNQVL